MTCAKEGRKIHALDIGDYREERRKRLDMLLGMRSTCFEEKKYRIVARRSI